MKALIEAYLKHTKHYLADGHILSIHDGDFNDDGVPVYVIRIKNDCLHIGEEIVVVTVTELLEFMWSRIK